MTKHKKTRYDVPECIEQEIREDYQAGLDDLVRLGLIEKGEVTSVEATPCGTEARAVFDVVIGQDTVMVTPSHEIKIDLVLFPPPMRWYWYLLPWKWKTIGRWWRFKAL